MCEQAALLASPSAVSATSPSPNAAFVQVYHEDRAAVRAELTAGLLLQHAAVSPKYLYDALGSRLFDAITELPEYYPTRTEAAIVEKHAADIGAVVPHGATLIDLGAGNCAKAARLFDVLHPKAYVAVDISVDFVRCAVNTLQERRSGMAMLGLGLDFSAELNLPPEVAQLQEQVDAAQRVLFYPGSSIGNFTPTEALHFLRQVRSASTELAPGGGLLIGVDLVKPVAVLEPAYDDALGVTAAFNLNMLLHLNHLLGANFNPRQWRHVAFFNTALSRIEMHLEAREALTVQWDAQAAGGGPLQRHFKAGERIHTECSYKWQPDDFEALLREAGFEQVQRWTDAQGWFGLYWAQATERKPAGTSLRSAVK
jgi:L-histidine Nalpha-methyltransferase